MYKRQGLGLGTAGSELYSDFRKGGHDRLGIQASYVEAFRKAAQAGQMCIRDSPKGAAHHVPTDQRGRYLPGGRGGRGGGAADDPAHPDFHLLPEPGHRNHGPIRIKGVMDLCTCGDTNGCHGWRRGCARFCFCPACRPRPASPTTAMSVSYTHLPEHIVVQEQPHVVEQPPELGRLQQVEIRKNRDNYLMVAPYAVIFTVFTVIPVVLALSLIHISKGTCIISANGTLPSMVIRRLEG